jgi:mono/diheme cytochrome c family protein
VRKSFLLLVVLVLAACGGVNSVYFDNAPCGDPTLSERNGVELYVFHCAKCHGGLSESTKRGVSAKEINEAISFVPEMDSLGCLTRQEIEAIAEVLNLKPNMSLSKKLEGIQAF